MQKKMFALVAAGLVSGVAVAQTNVTVYGIIDMAYIHQSDSARGVSNAYNAIDDDGNWNRSRFGFKGTEDLGNGLSVSFQQEFGLHADVNNGAISQRPAFVSVAGKGWGSIKAGNFWSVVDDTVSYSSAGGGGQVGWGEGVIDLSLITLANNAIQFDSLEYSGFKFSVGYSSHFQWDNNDDSAIADNNMRAMFAGASYCTVAGCDGGLYVGATYTKGKEGANNVDYDEWLIGASYDFKVAKVGLAYADAAIDGDANFGTSGTNELDRRTWRANVSVPFTAKDIVTLSYTDSTLERHDGMSDYDANAWGIAYMHELSKRTTVYASAYTADANHGFLVASPDGEPSYDAFETGFKVGIRHTF